MSDPQEIMRCLPMCPKYFIVSPASKPWRPLLRYNPSADEFMVHMQVMGGDGELTTISGAYFNNSPDGLAAAVRQYAEVMARYLNDVAVVAARQAEGGLGFVSAHP